MGKSSLSVGTKVWADRFNSCLHKSAEGWIAAGNVLIEAKKAVPKGDFHRLIERELHVDARTAQRFMAIAAHPVLSNATNLSRLPPTYTVLYQLTKLTEGQVQNGLKVGAIHPRMTNEDIIKMLAPPPIIIDVDHEDITPSADEADTPEHTTAIQVPGSAVPESADDQRVPYVADDREGGDSGHHPLYSTDPTVCVGEASVFDNEPGSPSAVALVGGLHQIYADLAMANIRALVREKASPAEMAEGHSGDLTLDEVSAIANWILDYEDRFRAIEEGRAAAE